MTARLEDLLEPGERVLFHAKRSWEPNGWLAEVLIYATSLGAVAATGLLSFDPLGWLSVATVLAGPWAHWLWVILRDWSREALVTERRLLHRSGWFTTTIAEVEAASVVEIRTVREKLRITRSDGERLDIGHPQEAWGLAGALASAAGLAMPRLQLRSEVALDRLFLTLGLTAWLAATLPALHWFYESQAVPLLSRNGLACIAGLFLVAQLLLPLALLIAGLLTTILSRPFFSQSKIEAWIDHSYAFWSYRASEIELDWHGRLCRRFASLLYRPPGTPDEEEANHGG